MKILHISAECYPAAKAGGLGDVVGALPKYLNQSGVEAAVIIPKYGLKRLHQLRFVEDYRGSVRVDQYHVPFVIEREIDDSFGFPFYVVNMPSKFERDGIYTDGSGYGFGDDVERWLCFQQAVLQWIAQFQEKPKVLHCHDHHTGLIPFMVKYAPQYQSLAHIPTVFTIHNGSYTGAFSWQNLPLLPYFQAEAKSLLDWAGTIHPLASAIRCAWKVTTVSNGYLHELKQAGSHLEWLLNNEWHKAQGILNGIDNQVWNPSTDPLIAERLKGKLLESNIEAFKKANKALLCQRFRIDPDAPLVTFIGRLVSEKGADLLPELIKSSIQLGGEMSFVVLGTGDPQLKQRFLSMRDQFMYRFDTSIEYNESLAHQLYAGSDFLIMPSRVEPCGLNQMYAMRYGTIPIVRSVGGLADTVSDIGESGGRGVRFNHFSVEDALLALWRSTMLYKDKELLKTVRKRIMNLDFSWEKSAQDYINLYNSL